MSRKSITKTLAIWAILALVTVPTVAVGQSMQDMQLFAFPDYSDYGRGAQPPEGYFFKFDGLLWSVSTPSITTIGNPNVTRVVYYDPGVSSTQGNTLDTSLLSATFASGQRYELGYVNNRRGLFFSAYQLMQTNNVGTGAFSMTFQDDVWGGSTGYRHLVGYFTPGPHSTDPYDLPVEFQSARVRNRVQNWNVELMALCRTHQLQHGGFLEFFAGARYMEFNDRFTVDAYGWWDDEGDDDDDDDDDDDTSTSATPSSRSILADSWWRQDADNHIIGPQVGFRWMKRTGRWWLNCEGRFFAGFNNMTAKQQGTLGSGLDAGQQWLKFPIAMDPATFSHRSFQQEWSPCFELRAGLDFQWTKNVKLGVGWTGIWIDNVARAADMVNYTLGQSDYMGILTNKQDVFMTGVNFSININR